MEAPPTQYLFPAHHHIYCFGHTTTQRKGGERKEDLLVVVGESRRLISRIVVVVVGPFLASFSGAVSPRRSHISPLSPRKRKRRENQTSKIEGGRAKRGGRGGGFDVAVNRKILPRDKKGRRKKKALFDLTTNTRPGPTERAGERGGKRHPKTPSATNSAHSPLRITMGKKKKKWQGDTGTKQQHTRGKEKRRANKKPRLAAAAKTTLGRGEEGDSAFNLFLLLLWLMPDPHAQQHRSLHFRANEARRRERKMGQEKTGDEGQKLFATGRD